MREVVASSDFIGVDKHGNDVQISVRVGMPYASDGGDAACPLSILDLHQHLPEIRGVDTLQALCLAIHTAKGLLKNFIEQGGKIYYSEKVDEAKIVTTAMIDQMFLT